MKKKQKSQDKEDIRMGTSRETLAQALLDNLYYVQRRLPELPPGTIGAWPNLVRSLAVFDYQPIGFEHKLFQRLSR